MLQVPNPNTRQKTRIRKEGDSLKKSRFSCCTIKKRGGKLMNYSYRGENPCLRTFPYLNTIFGSVAQTGQT